MNDIQKQEYSPNYLLDKANRLTPDFYFGNTTEIAGNLINKIFVRIIDNSIYAGKIVEVEAYEEKSDQASHSFRGKTSRNKVMFEQGGLLYVYLIYGVHYCANIVTGRKGIGNAILLRAMEPICGLEEMSFNRFGHLNGNKFKLLNGPGNICKAMNITTCDNGSSLTMDKMFIVNGNKNERSNILETERIGITKSKSLKWRFINSDSGYLSK